jgi:hypothetical protein
VRIYSGGNRRIDIEGDLDNATRKELTIMLTRTADAVWEGNLKDGKGTMKVGSGAFDGPYTN